MSRGWFGTEKVNLPSAQGSYFPEGNTGRRRRERGAAGLGGVADFSACKEDSAVTREARASP